MKKIIIMLMIVVGCINISYAQTNVEVQIPKFSTTINDVKFDNTIAKYPLIVYKDITYMPMTYDLCRELGLRTGWNNQKGYTL